MKKLTIEIISSRKDGRKLIEAAVVMLLNEVPEKTSENPDAGAKSKCAGGEMKEDHEELAET